VINKIRNLKATDMLFLVLIFGFFLFLITAERKGPENIKEQIIQQEPWLIKTSNYISDYMNGEKSDLWISNNGVSFTSIYSSPHFLPEKIESLRSSLVKTGWYELSPQDSSSNEELVALLGQPLTSTVILCKNKAMIVIWIDDLKKKYGNTTDMRTMIWLLFDSQTPCFDLESKNY